MIVTGATGQTGSWLVEELLKNPENQVYALTRRASTPNTSNIEHLLNKPNLKLVYGDLTDCACIFNLINSVKPDQFFNLAAQSHVGYSFQNPIHSFSVNALGVAHCLEGIRQFSPHTRFLQASTSELFGGELGTAPQNESTVMSPKSPYAIAKLAAYQMVINYRQSYNLFCCNSISYNHESTRRSLDFLPRKVTHTAARIKLGLQSELLLGEKSTCRDWIDARNVIRGLLMIINADKPDDFIMASGISRSVQQLVEYVFSKLDLNWQDYVKTDPQFLRPNEVMHLEGDYSKIKSQLGWEPTISFEQMIEDMLKHDLELAKKEIK